MTSFQILFKKTNKQVNSSFEKMRGFLTGNSHVPLWSIQGHP